MARRSKTEGTLLLLAVVLGLPVYLIGKLLTVRPSRASDKSPPELARLDGHRPGALRFAQSVSMQSTNVVNLQRLSSSGNPRRDSASPSTARRRALPLSAHCPGAAFVLLGAIWAKNLGALGSA